MQPALKNRSARSILTVLVLGLSAIYLVPFHVPVHDGLSDSYLFGFSNGTASVLLFIFALGFALWTNGLGLRLPDGVRRLGGPSTRMNAVAIGCSVCLCALIWLLARILAPFDEAVYFLDRYAMYGMGGRLYRDFEFDYGPLMFYPAVWISRLCHISIGNGYYIAWILQWGLGTWALWKVVEVAARGTRHGRTLFLLFWFFFLTAVPDSGPNYTPLRFCGGLALALGVYSLYARGASNFATFGLACAGATGMLFYSPEQGIVFAIGTVLFFAVCVRPARWDLLTGLGLFVLVMVFVFWLAARLGVLANVLTVGGGTLNFPLLFSFQSLVLLLLLIVAACAVVSSFRERTSQHFLIYLIFLSLASAPAAFSRADVGHVIINTLGALIAALAILSQYPAVWRWTWPAFAVMLVLSTYGKGTLFKDQVRDQIHDAVFRTQYHSPAMDKAYTVFYSATHRDARARLAKLRADFPKEPGPGLRDLPSGTHLLAPFGVQRRIQPPPDGIQIITGRYPWLFPMTSTGPVQEKIVEIESHPDWPLLLWSPEPQVCMSDPEEERRSLRRAMLAPYLPPPRRTINPGQPLCDYINANYVPGSYISPEPHSFVWVRKGSLAAAQTP